MLYQSASGTRFLDTLNEGHVKIIIDYINPEQWAIKFKRDIDVTKRVNTTLKDAGY
jgi:phenylpyruvate tautomerase PptA (4-oxalocrotonate tautomerase family)